MALLYWGRLIKKPSKKVVSAMKGMVRFNDDEGYWDISDGGEAFLRSYEMLRAEGNRAFNPFVHAIEDSKVHKQDREHITGYVIGSMDSLFLRNPPEDFKRPNSGACRTRLKDDAEVDLEEERPKGLFTAVWDEYIIHDDLLALFASEDFVGVKPVRFEGKILPDWNRLMIRRRERVLDEMNFAEVPGGCGGCSQPRIATMDEIWIAQSEKPIAHTTCDTRGKGHYGEVPILVISKETMAELRARKWNAPRLGLRLFSLYTKQTKRYEVLRKIRDAIAEGRED